MCVSACKLVATCTCTCMFDLVFLVFLHALKENGVEFVFDQEWMRFQGTITVVSADNLSAQMLGGYKALHSAFRKCRYCMATDETMQEKVI